MLDLCISYIHNLAATPFVSAKKKILFTIYRFLIGLYPCPCFVQLISQWYSTQNGCLCCPVREWFANVHFFAPSIYSIYNSPKLMTSLARLNNGVLGITRKTCCYLFFRELSYSNYIMINTKLFYDITTLNIWS